jgi:hypothetical protein
MLVVAVEPNGDRRKPRRSAVSLTAADLPPGDRIVRRIAEKTGQDFDHGDPADYLLRHRDVVAPKLSMSTLDRFEKLIDRSTQRCRLSRETRRRRLPP